MFQRIISPENLFLAWREFRKGKRTKSDVQQFEFALEDNVFQLHEELKEKTYQHGPYIPFSINDPKPRRIHKATVCDRLVHHAIFRMLYPIFDRSFIHDSYSCRVGKGTHRALRRLQVFARRNSWALKCDIRRFFDSIDHNILIALIRRKISDPDTLWLIGRILDSFCKIPNVGLPLGNVTSQLFANIYLNELDRFVKHELRIPCYLRYCDDFLLLGNSPEHLLVSMGIIATFLRQRLRLMLHPDKISLRTRRQGIDFVGYVVRPYCTTLRTKTRRRMLKRITFQNAPSYLGMLGHCRGYDLERKIEALAGGEVL